MEGNQGDERNDSNQNNIPNIHKMDWDFSQLKLEVDWILENLQYVVQALQFEHSNVPNFLEEFKDDPNLQPIYEINFRRTKKRTLEQSKKFNAANYPNNIPAMAGHASKGRKVIQGEERCKCCKDGNGRFGSCVQAINKDSKALFKGSCTNCIFGATTKKCTLSEDFNKPTKPHSKKRGAALNYMEESLEPSGPSKRKAKAANPAPINTGKYLKVPIPEIASLDTPRGIAACIKALAYLQGKLEAVAGSPKKAKNLAEIGYDSNDSENDDNEEEEE